jgi:hypothetical protein
MRMAVFGQLAAVFATLIKNICQKPEKSGERLEQLNCTTLSRNVPIRRLILNL